MAFLGNSFKKISENLKQNSHQKSKSGLVAAVPDSYKQPTMARK